MPALSVDHEFLINEGWKRYITPQDELAVFSYPFKYMRPKRVQVTPYESDLVFVQNERINIFATPDLTIHAHSVFSLIDVYSLREVGVINPVAEDIQTIEKKTTLDEAESIMLMALSSGNHASIEKSKNYILDQEYIVKTYNTNIFIDPKDPNTHIIHLDYTRGSSVITIEMPIPTPVCTRRYGKTCWVIL
jgi:hypothetical protein